ncbi:hypothetical protein [Chitinophaga sp.]|uniref:NAD(P)/FAD-dependent oxidoreductase n=1 Tax=Chitinophaga sp. TaxID=1869181 RepID=UPI0031DE4F58
MTKYDVCIFGGGPAGSAMAKRLIEMGYSVVVIEKVVFPRAHVGISLSPGVEHWLRVLKVEVDQSLSPRSLLLWENDEVVEKEGGWHVDRGWFDQLLLNASGARVIFGNAYPIENIHSEWDVYIEQELLFSARFLVAATGRRPLLKGRRRAILPVTVAAYARCISQTFIEAGRDCWYWGGGGLSFVFADPGEVQQFSSVKDFFAEKMRVCRLMSLKDFGEVNMCTATAYVDESPVGRNFIKIGDAVFTMDPLSAQGVQKALKTAVQGAVVVNTILKGDVSAGVAFYRNMISGEVSKHVRWTQQFYQSQGIYESNFWRQRSGQLSPLHPDQVLAIRKEDVLIFNPNAEIVPVPVLGSEMIHYEYGVKLPDSDEPFVYVSEKPVVELIRQLDQRCVNEGIHLFGMEILRWLVYHRIMIKAFMLHA